MFIFCTFASFFSRLEGTHRRIEELVLFVEAAVECLIQIYYEVRSSPQSIAAQIRTTAVRLSSLHCEADVKQVLFGHLDVVTVLIACIRDDNEILRFKQVWPLPEDIVQTVEAAGLFVRDERQTYVQAESTGFLCHRL